MVSNFSVRSSSDPFLRRIAACPWVGLNLQDEKSINSDPPSAEINQQALLLSTGELIFSLETLCNITMKKLLEMMPLSADGEAYLNDRIKKTRFRNSDSPRKYLLSPLALQIMFIIWRASPNISDESLVISGQPRIFDEERKNLTQNAISDVICENLNMTASEVKSTTMLVGRIVDALIVYDLVERLHIRPTLKPLRGTPRLHSLMTSVLAGAGELIAAQISGSQSEIDSSEEEIRPSYRSEEAQDTV